MLLFSLPSIAGTGIGPVLLAVGLDLPLEGFVALTGALVLLAGLFGTATKAATEESFDDDLDDWGDDEDDFDGEDDFDDWGDDDTDEDSGLLDLQDRVNRMENELGSLSSTMNTVREENREIGDTVAEIDETMRKLLDVYEIVTRGINPFVDDAEAMANIREGTYGLFDTDDEEDADDLDASISSADAESFFDDDFYELEAESSEDPATEDVAGVDEEFGSGTASTFDELKAEYESGMADWDGLDADSDEDGEEPEDLEESAFPDVELPGEDEPDVGDEPDVEDLATPISSDTSVDVAEFQSHVDPVSTPAVASSTGAGDEPYLVRLPDTYAGELLVMEWAKFLVSAGGLSAAVTAARYYETIGWISADVRQRLGTCLFGVSDDDDAATDGRLDANHHLKSLGYISRLANDATDAEFIDALTTSGGARHGIRR